MFDQFMTYINMKVVMSNFWKYIVLASLAAACVEFNSNDTLEPQSLLITFSVETSELATITTRSVDEDGVDNLYLLLFDENQRFISLNQASLLDDGRFEVTLPQSDKGRVVHFIANYSWEGFDSQEQQSRDEGEVVASMSSDELTFWQRVELSGGVNSDSFGSGVSLVRNMAKFTLSTQGDTELTDLQFALYNYPSIGSVAPFNTSSCLFEMVVSEPAGVNFTSNTPFTSSPIYSFERENSTATTTQTYIILSGQYRGEMCYYKVDIVDEQGTLYDIMRNYCYNIIVGEVSSRGYLTITEAQNSPASNNIYSSVLLQAYSVVSDGSYILSVDKTQLSLTSSSEPLSLKVSYHTVDGVEDNSQIRVSLTQDDATPVINGELSFDPSSGTLSADVADIPPDGVAYRAEIDIRAGNLSRTVQLVLHSPFTFQSVALTPDTLANEQGTPATLNFTIPDEAEYLLPIECYITTSHLTPVESMDIVREDGGYRYLWQASSVGVQSIDFKSNRSDAAETIYIDAELFERASVSYTNRAQLYSFSNVVISPYRVALNRGEAVTLRFTTPTSGLFNIATENLLPVDGSISNGVYSYSSLLSGEHTIEFVTRNQNSAESITLSADNYTDYTVELKNELVYLWGSVWYGNRNSSLLRNSTLYLLIDSEVVAITTTSSSGEYSVAIEAQIGDVLTFDYYQNSNFTYSDSVEITSSQMSVDPDLSR